jgi:hypothetical protein
MPKRAADFRADLRATRVNRLLRRRGVRSFVGLVALAALTATSSVTRVARADDDAASTELFNAGRDLMKRGDYAAACPKLAESVRLKATVGALGKLAVCEEHEGRLVVAYGRWHQALNLARSAGDERAAEAEREIARLDRVVPKLLVNAGVALPAGTVIRVDDATFGLGSLGVALAIEPGAHRVETTAPGFKPWSTAIQAAADGATTTVNIPPLEALPASAIAAVPGDGSGPPPAGGGGTGPGGGQSGSSPSPAPVAPSSPWPTIGLFGAGAGLVGVAAGGVLGLLAINQRNAAHCARNVCPDDPSAGKLNDAKTAADFSTGFFIGGGIVAATGFTLWLTTRDGHAAPARVGLAPVPGGLLLHGDWR